MLDLSPEIVRLIEITAAAMMLPWLAMLIVSLLARQLPRWGYSDNWGSERSTDIKLHGF